MMKSVTTFLFLQWCDCKVLRVIPPTQAEIDADVEAEREEQLKEEKEKQVWALDKCNGQPFQLIVSLVNFECPL